MAATSGPHSSARNSHRLRDLCCDLQAQRNTSSLLKGLLFTLPVIAVLPASVLLVLRFPVTPQIKAYVQVSRTPASPASSSPGTWPGSAATTASSFFYNVSISVALTVCNTNGAMAIKYTKPLVATLLFDDRRLYNVNVVGEGHRHMPLEREVHLLHTDGEASYVLDAAAEEEFKKQNATGVIKVEMRLSIQITLGIGNKRVLELSCPLKLRRPSPGPDVVFSTRPTAYLTSP